MDAGERGDGRKENQWGGEIEVAIAWQTCLDGRGKKEDCMQVQEVEGERQKEMEIVHVCQEILKLLTAGMGVKGEQ